MSGTPQWIDRFLFWDSTLVSVLITLDWLLDPKERALVKEILVDWWIFLEATPFRAFVAQDAKRLLNVILRLTPRAIALR